MGRQIIIKEAGTIAVWSTIVDDFIFDGAPEEYIEMCRQDEADRAEKDIREILTALKDGGRPYRRFQMTYADACALKDDLARAEAEDEDEDE